MTIAPALVHIITCSPTCYLGPSPTLPSSLISKVGNKPSAGACASDVNQLPAQKPSPTTTTSHTYPRSPCLPPPPPPLLYSLSPLLPLHPTPLPLQLSPTPPYPHYTLVPLPLPLPLPQATTTPYHPPVTILTTPLDTPTTTTTNTTSTATTTPYHPTAISIPPHHHSTLHVTTTTTTTTVTTATTSPSHNTATRPTSTQPYPTHPVDCSPHPPPSHVCHLCNAVTPYPVWKLFRGAVPERGPSEIRVLLWGGVAWEVPHGPRVSTIKGSP
jgi:hypothetical protein